MEVNAILNSQTQQLDSQNADSSSMKMSPVRKFLWLFFRLFVIAGYVVLPIYLVLGLLQSGGLVGRFLTLWSFLFLPIGAIFGVFLWSPLIISSRKIITSAAIITTLVVLLIENLVVPVKYFFPQSLLLLFLLYGLFFILSFKLVLPLGEAIKDILYGWLVSYQSPKTLSDLIKNAPKNIVSGVKVNLLRFIAGVLFLTIIFIITFITESYPSVWGVGILEVKNSFPNNEEYQKAVLEKFFITNPLLKDFTFQQYTRNVSIGRSLCRISTTGDSRLGYINFSGEIIAADKITGKTLTFAMVKNNYLPLLESNMLDKEAKKEVLIYSYSKTHYLLAYPGMGDNPNRLYQQPTFIGNSYERDKHSRWLLKDKNLLCSTIDNSMEEDKLIYLLKLFTTRGSLESSSLPEWVEPTSVITLKEESSPQEQNTTNILNQVPEAAKNLNQKNLPLDFSEVWTLERDWLESGYTPQQREQGGIKLERDWLTVFIPPRAAPVNSSVAFMLVPEPTDEDLSNIWLDNSFQISGSSDDKRNQLKDLQFNLVIYQPLNVNDPRLALLHKETLNYYFWDRDKSEWIPVPSIINFEKGYALAKYNKFGTYSLRGNPVNKAPKIFGVEPNKIKYNQDVVITIKGENFQSDSSVNFGMGSYSLEFVDGNTIRVRMKEGNNFLISPGTYELMIRNPDGQGARLPEALKVEE